MLEVGIRFGVWSEPSSPRVIEILKTVESNLISSRRAEKLPKTRGGEPELCLPAQLASPHLLFGFLMLEPDSRD